jgi:ankyrin repeat protein
MVVSWREESQDQEVDEIGRMVISNPSHVDGGSANGSAVLLFVLARIGNWNEFLVSLERMDPEEIRGSSGPIDAAEPGENILHAVVSHNHVPLVVVENILRRTGDNEFGHTANSIVSAQNHMRQTPLHLAVMKNATRSDLIKCLYDVNPATVQVRDDRQLRPIDEITTKIIMMEEVLKYSRNDERKKYRQRLSSLWKTAAVLVGATTDLDVDDADRSDGRTARMTYLVHACIQSREVPFALTERAMKHNKEQLALPDSNGDLPLHIIAGIPPRVRHDTDENETDDDEGDVLERVLCLNPDAACKFNNDQQIPLMVAIRAGRLWDTGVFRLLNANPVGIQELKLPAAVYPFLFRHLADYPDIVYQIIQSMPGLSLRT